MIYQTICKSIEEIGVDCVLTECDDKKYILRGIIQPIGVKNREYSQKDYTIQGSVDNSDFLFIFNVPKESIDFQNAVLWVERNGFNNNRYWFKSFKPFYYKDNPIYYSAVLSPYVQELL